MKTLYHGTSSVNLDSIKKLGLVPGHAKGGDAWAKDHHWSLAAEAEKLPPTVCVTDQQSNAKDFAHTAVEEIGGDPVVIELRVPEAVFQTYVFDDLFSSNTDDPHAWRAHKVSPSYIVGTHKVKAGPAPFMGDLDALFSLLHF